MKILHSYCLNYNIGDHALGIGLKSLLRQYLSVDLIGETNIQGREFNEYYINDVVNKKYDLLVIGGGGIIHGMHWPNGWFWLINKDLIKTIKIPFIIYGAGYNYWKDEGGIPERGIGHLKETIKNAAYFSVRNDGSAKRLLEQIGIDVPTIPDPGFHVNINMEYKNYVNEPYVIVQIANDKPEHRFKSLNKKQKFVLDLKEVTKNISKKYKVIFAPHVYSDISISEEIVSGIDNAEVWDFGSFAFDHSDKAIGFYKYAEFAIVMRGHGQIYSICFNTPVISLENHPKHRGLMEGLGLLEYNVNINELEFKDILVKKIRLLENKKEELVEKYKNINACLRKDTHAAFNEIIKKI